MVACTGRYVPNLSGMRACLSSIEEKKLLLEASLVADDIFHAVGNFTVGFCNQDICPALFRFRRTLQDYQRTLNSAGIINFIEDAPITDP